MSSENGEGFRKSGHDRGEGILLDDGKSRFKFAIRRFISLGSVYALEAAILLDTSSCASS